jgi:hypothetical protein
MYGDFLLFVSLIKIKTISMITDDNPQSVRMIYVTAAIR